MKNNNIESIFFDIGNVLFYFDLNIALNKVSERIGVSSPIISKNMEYDTDRFERGIIDRFEYYRSFSGKFGNEIEFLDFCYIFNNIFEPNYALLDILGKLGEKYQLTIVSNTNELHIEFLKDNYQIYFNYFDTEIYSHKTGYKKPQADFFHKAIEISNTDYGKVLYFDDLKENIEAGISLGIKSIQYDGNYNFSDLF